MNENSKTIAFIVAAVAVLLLAVATRPKPPAPPTDELVGKSLFPSLDDPLKAKRLRIVTFDESTSRAREFEVAQIEGVWSLPSNKNYPADAKEQLAAAAGSLVDLKVLGKVGEDDARQHELYGVIEPDTAKDQFGQRGIGKLIVLEDESKKPLAKLIIGKEDKGSQAKTDEFAPQQSELRFVRVPGQDRVYRVSMSTDKFSTRFADWIETDLLKINPWDIAEVRLRDYSVTEALTRDGEMVSMLSQRADILVAYDDRAGKWSLKEFTEYRKNKPEKVSLTAEQEVDTAKLNELKNALDNLKIIDVARKPEQVSANLRAGKAFLTDSEARDDLTRRGFRPVPAGQDQIDIVSNDGEVTVRMKDGVEYVVRFGAIAGIDSASQEDGKDAPADGKADDGAKDESAGDKKGTGLSRYIMAMAQFNPDLIPKPQLEELPEIPKAPEKPAEGKAAAKGADGKAAKGGDAKAAETEEPVDLEELEALRDRIEKENRRKQDEYDEKIKQGQQRAKELNTRFADWYYVVNDETYRKIHLGKDDIIKKKSTEPAAQPTVQNPFDLQGLPGGGGEK